MEKQPQPKKQKSFPLKLPIGKFYKKWIILK